MGKDVQFLSDEIKIAGTNYTFQIAQIKNKWAIRIIDRKENKIIIVNKLKKTTDAVITDNIKNSLGRKFGKKIIQEIDFFDLGGKMPDLLRKIQEYKDKKEQEKEMDGIDPKVKILASTDKLEELIKKKRKTASKSDSFWSTYSSADMAAKKSAEKETPTISFDLGAIESQYHGSPSQSAETTPVPSNAPTPTQPSVQNSVPPPNIAPSVPQESPQTPKISPDLADSLSVLGLTCPNCGAEVDLDDEI